jgi:hypothetical protein
MDQPKRYHYKKISMIMKKQIQIDDKKTEQKRLKNKTWAVVGLNPNLTLTRSPSLWSPGEIIRACTNANISAPKPLPFLETGWIPPYSLILSPSQLYMDIYIYMYIKISILMHIYIYLYVHTYHHILIYLYIHMIIHINLYLKLYIAFFSLPLQIQQKMHVSTALCHHYYQHHHHYC